ncbi:DEAD box helicase, putative [Plasmodium sp. gorilla clade G2]|uniref:DEAD box helicase, putative n=1 Tax=Plasmodium sp. gorilla clade G2 TaxID=880535 RepID=UPI000D203FD4|nr:DEAD box helicase, putative [Plasmodium sp. gorilla clade G2]SOV10822.1 DEAD box helicase, putative [Plasmodium sp. gorilla clade G2]
MNNTFKLNKKRKTVYESYNINISNKKRYMCNDNKMDNDNNDMNEKKYFKNSSSIKNRGNYNKNDDKSYDMYERRSMIDREENASSNNYKNKYKNKNNNSSSNFKNDDMHKNNINHMDSRKNTYYYHKGNLDGRKEHLGNKSYETKNNNDNSYNIKKYNYNIAKNKYNNSDRHNIDNKLYKFFDDKSEKKNNNTHTYGNKNNNEFNTFNDNKQNNLSYQSNNITQVVHPTYNNNSNDDDGGGIKNRKDISLSTYGYNNINNNNLLNDNTSYINQYNNNNNNNNNKNNNNDGGNRFVNNRQHNNNFNYNYKNVKAYKDKYKNGDSFKSSVYNAEQRDNRDNNYYQEGHKHNVRHNIKADTSNNFNGHKNFGSFRNKQQMKDKKKFFKNNERGTSINRHSMHNNNINNNNINSSSNYNYNYNCDYNNYYDGEEERNNKSQNRGDRNSDEIFEKDSVISLYDSNDNSNMIEKMDYKNEEKDKNKIKILLTEDNMNNAQSNIEKLSIYKSRNEIIEMIEKNDVTFINGETGSGKSTCVPKFLLEENILENKKINIIVTEPRRIACIALSKILCELTNEQLGEKIGYRISGESLYDNEKTVITYITIGYLFKLFLHHKNMYKKFTHVIIDEIHDRSILLDIVLLFIKLYLHNKQKDEQMFKLIIMSATMQSNLFYSYFEHPNIKMGSIFIGTKIYSIDTFYIEDIINYTRYGTRKIYSDNKICDDNKIGGDDKIFGDDKICGDGNNNYVKESVIEFILRKKNCNKINLSRNSEMLLYKIKSEYDKNIHMFNNNNNNKHCNDKNKDLDVDEIIPANVFSNISNLCLELVYNLCLKGDSVIIFLSGMQDITDMYHQLSMIINNGMGNPSNNNVENMNNMNNMNSEDNMNNMNNMDSMNNMDNSFMYHRKDVRIHIHMLHSCLYDNTIHKIKHNDTDINIFLSSNIAESSITIPNVRLVIDFCIQKNIEYNDKKKAHILVKKWINKSSMEQRKGRCGRTCHGICIRMISKNFLNLLRDHKISEIYTHSLHLLYLYILKSMPVLNSLINKRNETLGCQNRNVDNLNDVKVQNKLISNYETSEKNISHVENKKLSIYDVLSMIIEKPSRQKIKSTRYELEKVKAVIKIKDKLFISIIGQIMIRFNLSINLCRLLLYGVLLDVTFDTIIIISILNTNDIFPNINLYSSKNIYSYAVSLEVSSKQKSYFDGNTYSEPIMLRNVFLEWLCVFLLYVQGLKKENKFNRKELKTYYMNTCSIMNKRNHINAKKLLCVINSVHNLCKKILKILNKNSNAYESCLYLLYLLRGASDINYNNANTNINDTTKVIINNVVTMGDTHMDEINGMNVFNIVTKYCLFDYSNQNLYLKFLFSLSFTPLFIHGSPNLPLRDLNEGKKKSKKLMTVLNFMIDNKLDVKNCIYFSGIYIPDINILKRAICIMCPYLSFDIYVSKNIYYVYFHNNNNNRNVDDFSFYNKSICDRTDIDMTVNAYINLTQQGHDTNGITSLGLPPLMNNINMYGSNNNINMYGNNYINMYCPYNGMISYNNNNVMNSQNNYMMKMIMSNYYSESFLNLTSGKNYPDIIEKIKSKLLYKYNNNVEKCIFNNLYNNILNLIQPVNAIVPVYSNKYDEINNASICTNFINMFSNGKWTFSIPLFNPNKRKCEISEYFNHKYELKKPKHLFLAKWTFLNTDNYKIKKNKKQTENLIDTNNGLTINDNNNNNNNNINNKNINKDNINDYSLNDQEDEPYKRGYYYDDNDDNDDNDNDNDDNDDNDNCDNDNCDDNYLSNSKIDSDNNTHKNNHDEYDGNDSSSICSDQNKKSKQKKMKCNLNFRSVLGFLSICPFNFDIQRNIYDKQTTDIFAVCSSIDYSYTNDTYTWVNYVTVLPNKYFLTFFLSSIPYHDNVIIQTRTNLYNSDILSIKIFDSKEIILKNMKKIKHKNKTNTTNYYDTDSTINNPNITKHDLLRINYFRYTISKLLLSLTLSFNRQEIEQNMQDLKVSDKSKRKSVMLDKVKPNNYNSVDGCEKNVNGINSDVNNNHNDVNNNHNDVNGNHNDVNGINSNVNSNNSEGNQKDNCDDEEEEYFSDEDIMSDIEENNILKENLYLKQIVINMIEENNMDYINYNKYNMDNIDMDEHFNLQYLYEDENFINLNEKWNNNKGEILMSTYDYLYNTLKNENDYNQYNNNYNNNNYYNNSNSSFMVKNIKEKALNSLEAVKNSYLNNNFSIQVQNTMNAYERTNSEDFIFFQPINISPIKEANYKLRSMYYNEVAPTTDKFRRTNRQI